MIPEFCHVVLLSRVEVSREDVCGGHTSDALSSRTWPSPEPAPRGLVMGGGHHDRPGGQPTELAQQERGCGQAATAGGGLFSPRA